jgi:DNA-binding transcriptional regulator GbsR (MarR family)
MTESKFRELGSQYPRGTIDVETQSRKLLRIASESPMVGRSSEIRRSFKDVASYLTPNKSSSKSMNHTSQQAHSVFAVENIYKMIENCVKMECAGCRKLIPTHLFYDHLITNQCGLL